MPTPHTFYRLMVWIPIAVPAMVAAVVHVLDVAVALQKIVQVLR